MSIRRTHTAHTASTVRTVIAGALSAVIFSSAIAAPEEETASNATLVVTATRFRADDRMVAANVTTLTAADIATLPAANLPELLATRAGIDVSSLYGGQAADAAISLRGFGENASLRTLIIVDGRRLEQLEFTTPNWSSIPLDSVERIEIVRGSGSVLYGDQAVAGVINIVTHRGKENAADVALTLGSFNSKAVSASLSRNDTPLRFAVTATHQESDEYRRNNAQRNTAGSLRVARDLASGEIYAEIGASELRYELPGMVSAAQYANNPRASETNDSWFQRENHYLRPGLRWQATPDLELAVELSLEQSRNRSWISNWSSWRETTVRTTAISPRLRWSHGLGSVPSTTVVGIDWSDASLDQDHALSPNGAATGKVSLDRQGGGFYLHNITEPLAGVAITLGAREQRFRSRATDAGVAGATNTAAATDKKSAAEFGVAWQPAVAWKLFAKASNTFRYPVLDEWTTFGGLASPPARPESGRGTDLGFEWRAAGHSVQVTRYDLKMEDEITWNNLTFQNENLQQTRHRGVEVDSRWQLAANWRFDLSWSSREATFREGANAGNAIPLVPETRWTAMLAWNGQRYGRHALLANHVGARYFGGDQANVRQKLPAYTTLDWQSSWQLQQWAQWELGLRVANLTDRKYSPSGFDYGFGAAYYPANPRAAYLTARYRF